MLLNKTILVVVPARGCSKGIKLKNMCLFKGTPLVALVGKIVQQLPYVDKAIVSTDHPEIARVAAEAGLDAPFMRPEAISGDMISDWDVSYQALLEVEKIDQRKYDIIVMLQPTSPLRKARHVTATIKKLIEGDFDAVWTVSKTDSKAHPLKQLTIENDRLDYYDKQGGKIVARQQLKPVYHRNGAAYAFTRECLIEQKTTKGRKTSAVVVADPMINIDTAFDIQLGEYISKGISIVE